VDLNGTWCPKPATGPATLAWLILKLVIYPLRFLSRGFAGVVRRGVVRSGQMGEAPARAGTAPTRPVSGQPAGWRASSAPPTRSPRPNGSSAAPNHRALRTPSSLPSTSPRRPSARSSRVIATSRWSHAVRQPLYWAEDRLRRLGARPDYLTDPAWWRGFERVAQQGLTWDLLLYDEQLPAAHKLIQSFPQARIVLEAAGWPLDQSADGFRRWQERLEAVSQFPNVTLKLQGLALLFGPSADAVAPWARAAVQIFGPQRCMFAAHFPVDRLLWSYDELIRTLLAVLG
jgi:hypothetical protein